MGAFPDNAGAGVGTTPPDVRAQSPREGQSLTRLVARIFLIAGLVAMGVAAYLAWDQMNPNRNWPRVTGVVTNGQLAGEAGGSSGPVYRGWLEFRYTVQGKDYVGNTGDSWIAKDRSLMEWRLRQYTIGSSHPIRYNPADPTQVALEPPTTTVSFTAALIVGGIGLCVVVVSLFGLVDRPRREPFPET